MSERQKIDALKYATKEFIEECCGLWEEEYAGLIRLMYYDKLTPWEAAKRMEKGESRRGRHTLYRTALDLINEIALHIPGESVTDKCNILMTQGYVECDEFVGKEVYDSLRESGVEIERRVLLKIKE